jgi:protein phosphatase
VSRLEVTDDLEVFAATHVGRVRPSNQDDYLIHVPPLGQAERAGRLFAIADGMGGVAGGAQASRAALRALGVALAAGSTEVGDAGERLRAGFDAASARVHEVAAATSGLSDMGTTMTALLLFEGRGHLAHVGDTRCLRIRGGVCEQLTVDHAMREPRNLLTRAIGAGQRHEIVDLLEVEVRPGDLFVLCTDGVWGEVTPEEIQQDLRGGSLRRGCERLLGRVFERGAPDNATVVAVRVLATTIGANRAIELPAREARIGQAGNTLGRSRLASRWPYLLLAVSIVLGLLAWLRAAHGISMF